MIASGAAAICVVALAQPLWAASLLLAGALRGTGNTWLPLLITSGSTWGAVGIAYLLVLLAQPSLVMVWLPIALLSPLEVASFWWAWRCVSTRPAAGSSDVRNAEDRLPHLQAEPAE
jgi:Na+-driven multidrug efflux pump